MTLEQLFDRPRTRAIFLSAIIVIVLLLYLIRYLVLPRFDPALSQGGLLMVAKILEDISATIVVTVVVAVFLWWITPYKVRNSGVTIVEPRELRRHFSDALKNTREWRFVGGCGRYFRSAVLTEMTRRASEESISKSVEAVILNPENTPLCERHARYRSNTRRGKSEGGWTASRVKQELLATIVITKKHKHGLVDAEVFLSDHFSSFRMDISQGCAIETREDSTAPALRSESDSYYYQALSDEYRLIKEQARKIANGEGECCEVIDLATLNKAIEAMNLRSIGLSDSELEGVVALIKNPRNPYE